MKKPYISVIITAYNRKEFLKEAVNSVLDQTLDKDIYELIVIKNFITEFDQEWKSRGIKLIYKPVGSIGDFLYTGVSHSRGSIISFLDDDDTFAKNKLKIIYNEFSKNPSIVYYHNNCKVIYENKYIKRKNNNIITTNVKKRFFANVSSSSKNEIIEPLECRTPMYKKSPIEPAGLCINFTPFILHFRSKCVLKFLITITS